MPSVTVPAEDVKVGDFIACFGVIEDVRKFDKKVANTKKVNYRAERSVSKDRIAEIEQENSESAISSSVVLKSTIGNSRALDPRSLVSVIRKV